MAGTCTIYVLAAVWRMGSIPPVFGHVSVTELGQGQKAAALIETVKPLDKEMNQWP